MKEKQNAALGTAPLGRLMLKFALPCTVSLLAVPLTSSFCQFVLRDGCMLIDHSGQDARLNGHPYQGILNSYIGLPLTHSGADLQGTLCHFDFEPIEVPQHEHEFLRKAALLPRYLRLG